MELYSYEKVVTNIKRLLKERDEKKKDFATAIGILPNDVSAKLSEKSKKRFTLTQIFDIAEHFGVSLDELCSDKNDFQIGQKVETVSDVLSFLFGFDLDETIEIRIEEEKHKSPNIKDEYLIKKAYVRFMDRVPFALVRALCEWNELEHALKNSGVKDSDRIVANWKKSVLSECENIQF